MRTSALQYLYLQKPVSTVIFVCLFSILPWIATGDFSTKGEPREAAVAVSMLETGNWTLPTVYADEFAYKPPMVHWLMAACSLPQGYVSELTARLPSAIAYTALMAIVLIFLGRRVRFQEAFIAVCLLFTCVEIHRAGMTARVDMVLTTFMVAGLIQMYRWEEKLSLKGLPVGIPLLFSGAVLTKGPVGIILPLFVFGVYLLMLRKYNFLRIFKALFYTFVASLFIPMLWYIEAWKQGGDEFLNVVLAENFGRFFHLSEANISYELGHKEGFWYNFITLAAGFMPWTLLLFFSLFGMRRRKLQGRLGTWLRNVWSNILSLDKVRLFSLVASVCIVFFYMLPSSKRSVYLMPAYPFIALFMSQGILYLTEHRSKLTRVFAGVLTGVASVAFMTALLSMTGMVDLVALAGNYTTKLSALQSIEAVSHAFRPSVPTIIVLILLLSALLTSYYQLFKKINIKMLYASIFLVFCVHLFIDGIVMRGIRNENSSRAFAREIRDTYSLNKDKLFVMNNLRQYTNLYGLNFYLGNCFHNFETEQPQTGYFLADERDYPKILERYAGVYTFEELRTSDRILADVKARVVLSRFVRK
ncbi:ArnT family glycosyltransferase [Tannerella forsythia]|uniref:Dolichyl-phosphate-mannose--protein mannosyltransferase n=1 Tax=Tannerella forsythia TaxID=28112 RepID=A0A3P1YIU7_TANFO|nr:glycosyltransferase family 39 protein [Tannerella forsythia]RRD70070.1 dolichyl-phosphate-mannose--protein mannosyltransferase [Tannerella forsythia]